MRILKRIGVYGGSFNPPHIGHLDTALQALESLELDKLILIPAGIPPHKFLDPNYAATGQQRLEMLRIAAAGEDRIEVSDLELKREGPSYTSDTLALLRQQYPDAQLYLLMGTDMFMSLQTWHAPEDIIRDAVLAVAYRGEKNEAREVARQKAVLEQQGARVVLLENRVTFISSTQLRRLIAFGCDAFLPEGVGDYIRQEGLFDSRKDWKNLPMEELELIVVRLLNPNRVAHVLGCRDTAVELARHWGADETDAARAGILHDITKALDGPLQLTICDCYGTVLSDFSKRYPRTLHAHTGAMVAERIFGENAQVVDAIRNHTTGKADMSLLEKILYVADYMEPNRDFPGVERLRELACSDITAALKLGLEMTLEHLKHQGNEVSPESREALLFLKDHPKA